ncbi:putative signal peptide protein [Puccinia sorghi]|uniref:Putative signal peptide protein n=1 Tax=Puccinia sorghi TaxID=27349 RepID=A0A0L6UFP2_9BASI|nr:putative signal peptide protein [Puccinia sorghi]
MTRWRICMIYIIILGADVARGMYTRTKVAEGRAKKRLEGRVANEASQSIFLVTSAALLMRWDQAYHEGVLHITPETISRQKRKREREVGRTIDPSLLDSLHSCCKLHRARRIIGGRDCESLMQPAGMSGYNRFKMIQGGRRKRVFPESGLASCAKRSGKFGAINKRRVCMCIKFFFFFETWLEKWRKLVSCALLFSLHGTDAAAVSPMTRDYNGKHQEPANCGNYIMPHQVYAQEPLVHPGINKCRDVKNTFKKLCSLLFIHRLHSTEPVFPSWEVTSYVSYTGQAFNPPGSSSNQKPRRGFVGGLLTSYHGSMTIRAQVEALPFIAHTNTPHSDNQVLPMHGQLCTMEFAVMYYSSPKRKLCRYLLQLEMTHQLSQQCHFQFSSGGLHGLPAFIGRINHRKSTVACGGKMLVYTLVAPGVNTPTRARENNHRLPTAGFVKKGSHRCVDVFFLWHNWLNVKKLGKRVLQNPIEVCPLPPAKLAGRPCGHLTSEGLNFSNMNQANSLVHNGTFNTAFKTLKHEILIQFFEGLSINGGLPDNLESKLVLLKFRLSHFFPSFFPCHSFFSGQIQYLYSSQEAHGIKSSVLDLTVSSSRHFSPYSEHSFFSTGIAFGQSCFFFFHFFFTLFSRHNNSLQPLAKGQQMKIQLSMDYKSLITTQRNRIQRHKRS